MNMMQMVWIVHYRCATVLAAHDMINYYHSFYGMNMIQVSDIYGDCLHMCDC